MKKRSNASFQKEGLSRRKFFRIGGLAVGGSTLTVLSPKDKILDQEEKESETKIKRYRTLGRTGFKVSDISMGNTRNRDSNVVRYAYDNGVNYFDTAETYANGESENLIGEALKFMDRKKVFITTKLHLGEKDNEKTILDRFRKCQNRLQTDYVDALFIHNPSDTETLYHPGFHSATRQLKQEGRLKYIGTSCHGPRGRNGQSMETIISAAAEDGRFDIVLFIYNFMNREEGNKLLSVCKKNNVGTTAMKTSPGVLNRSTFDPEDITNRQRNYIKRMMERGMSREKAVERIKRRIKSQNEDYRKTKPFVEKYGIKTKDQLLQSSIQWVLQNPDMHTACISFSDFDLVDKTIPLSGTKLSYFDISFLRDYKQVFNDQYCRHGCNICSSECINDLPISTIMRYAYYFELQGREKDAMIKYSKLDHRNASNCETCDAPCNDACPNGLDIQQNLLQAHSMLTLA